MVGLFQLSVPGVLKNLVPTVFSTEPAGVTRILENEDTKAPTPGPGIIPLEAIAEEVKHNVIRLAQNNRII